ncbi:ROK family transcriptional regulator [Arthrobacter sp. AET 35A]|nr:MULTISPECIES: ROK family transcriptional regulator [unclassified Arthrobacter]
MPGGRTGPGSQRALRRLNEQSVLSVVRDHGPISQADLARRTGLSRATVSILVASLRIEGSVCTSVGVSSGRRAVLVESVNEETLFAGVTYLPDGIVASLVDSGGTIVARSASHFMRQPKKYGVQPCPQIVVAELMQESGIPLNFVAGVSVAADPRAPLPGCTSHDHVAVMPVLGEVLSLTEATALSVATAGRERTLFIDVGLEISATMLTGRSLLPCDPLTSQLAHLRVGGSTLPCPVCRRTGCLDAVASLAGMATVAGAADIAKTPGPTRAVEEFLDLVQHDDQGAVRVVSSAALTLGEASAAMITFAGITNIVLAVPSVLAARFVKDFTRSLRSTAYLPYSGPVSIASCTRDPHATAVGAALHALHTVTGPRTSSIAHRALST